MRFHSRDVITDQYDSAIFFASYEPRCVEVARRLVASGYNGRATVFFCRDLDSSAITANVETMLDLLGGHARAVPVSYSDPAGMVHAVRALPLSESVLVDVSCFNRGNLFPFLWASTWGRLQFPHITFAYAAPQNYGNWLSRDYSAPRNIVGFPGSTEFPKERLLVCVVGYEVDRALAVVAAAEPSKVVLTVGSIPTKSEFLTRNRHAVELVHGSSAYEVVPIDVSDPQECMTGLAGILASASPDTSIGIAPFSTKLSCLAIWGLWVEKPSIRLWNAQPAIYNILSYSKGSLTPRCFDVVWGT